MLNGEPCTIRDIGVASGGKVGGTRYLVDGHDIFTGRRREDRFKQYYMVEVPYVRKEEWKVLHLDSATLSVFGKRLARRRIFPRFPESDRRSAEQEEEDFSSPEEAESEEEEVYNWREKLSVELPQDTVEDAELAQKIVAAVAAGREVKVEVLCCMKKKKIVAFKEEARVPVDEKEIQKLRIP